jgi:hypothetical protein
MQGAHSPIPAGALTAGDPNRPPVQGARSPSTATDPNLPPVQGARLPGTAAA